MLQGAEAPVPTIGWRLPTSIERLNRGNHPRWSAITLDARMDQSRDELGAALMPGGYLVGPRLTGQAGATMNSDPWAQNSIPAWAFTP